MLSLDIAAPVVVNVKKKICLREAAKIANIAKDTGCKITFKNKNGEGSSDSVISLAKLEMKPDYTVIIEATGENPTLAYSLCMKLFAGET